MRCVNPFYEHVFISWEVWYWHEMQYIFWQFYFLGGWTIAKTLNHCRALSETSKYSLEFLEIAFFSDILHVNYASYNLHIG